MKEHRFGIFQSIRITIILQLNRLALFKNRSNHVLKTKAWVGSFGFEI